MRTTLLICLGSAGLVAGCGLTLDYVPPEDGALPDAGVGPVDARAGNVDAAPIDGGGVDTGVPPGDDGGPADAGGDAVVCTDADGDGAFDCSGDCDDGDPTVFPGAPVVCGDGVDNGCTDSPGDEPACGGIGTYVSSTVGVDTNPGTQASPVATITQGLANAQTIGRGVDVYVAEGAYPMALTMVEGHSVLCGYEASGWARDTDSYVATIENASHNGVVFPSGVTNETMLEGCTVLARTNAFTSSAIEIPFGGSGAVRDNIIVAGTNSGRSDGVVVYPSARSMSPAAANRVAPPLIELNEIVMGGSASGWGPNQGSHGITVRSTEVHILQNEVTFPDSRTHVFGIEVIQSPAGTLIHGNEIRGPGSVDLALGLRLISGSAEISQNDVYPGSCPSDWCVAAEVNGQFNGVKIHNNIFIGGETGSFSAGLLIGREGDSSTGTDLLVHSNFLMGGEYGAPASTALGYWYGDGDQLNTGRIINNILYAGGGANGYAVWERTAQIDPERFEHNALLPAGLATGTAGSLYYDEGGTRLDTIAAVNALAESRGGNIQDDCAIVDPRVDGDFHLAAGSLCIDAGSSREVPSFDYEGESRPRGAAPDLGPDEAM